MTDLRPSGLDDPGPQYSFASLLDAVGIAPHWSLPEDAVAQLPAPEATTVLALRFTDGVVMVGDRQATEGYTVAHRRVQKVYAADRLSAIAIAGTAGVALELVRLFQTELEHYEKLEGVRLSLEGKANHLAGMVRRQLPMAFQGLIAVPLFCGYDDVAGQGRIYTYDVVGGRYEEQDFAATGSGGREAKAYLRGAFRDELDRDEGLRVGLGALVAAAEEDTATGGPDPRRGIYPNVVIIGPDGFIEVPDDEVGEVSERVLESMR